MVVLSSLPFQVVQQEKERDQIWLWQRQQQVEHTALFSYTVRQSCGKNNVKNKMKLLMLTYSGYVMSV